jgi:hypothetical protein
MQRMLVGRSRGTLVLADLGFEVVVVGLGCQSRKHLDPDRLGDKKSESVVGSREFLDVAGTEQVGKTLLERLQVGAEPTPNHDAVGVDGLAVVSVSLPGTDGTEETVLGENPHSPLLLELPLDVDDPATRIAGRLVLKRFSLRRS